ncbi:MAG: hypothetical protein RSD48_06615 [Oscillospiraceae bacterium]
MDKELTGTYPIVFDGSPAGELTVSRDGLFLNFDAYAVSRTELVRLSVYGLGGEGYLGVMEPRGDALTLHKKLSRAALYHFPDSITHAGFSGGETDVTEEIELDISREAPPSPAVVAFPLVEVSSPPEAELSEVLPCVDLIDDVHPPPTRDFAPPLLELQNADTHIWKPCPCPCSLFQGLEAKTVCNKIRGAWVAVEGNCSLLAVPQSIASEIENRALLNFREMLNIFGEPYSICKISDGKSVQ